MSTKNSNDTIGNRTRDLPACNAVPQPTAPPRAFHGYIFHLKVWKEKAELLRQHEVAHFDGVQRLYMSREDNTIPTLIF